MEWDEVLADWQRFEPLLTSKWNRMTAEDLLALRERRELLADSLERRYRIQAKHADMQATRWLADLKPLPSVTAEEAV